MNRETIKKLNQKDKTTWNYFIKKYLPLIFNLYNKIFKNEKQAQLLAERIILQLKKEKDLFNHYNAQNSFRNHLNIELKEYLLYFAFIDLKEEKLKIEQVQYIRTVISYFYDYYFEYKIKSFSTIHDNEEREKIITNFLNHLLQMDKKELKIDKKEHFACTIFFEKMINLFFENKQFIIPN